MHAFSDARERRCDDTIRDGVSSARAKRFSSAPYTLLLRLHFYTQCKGKREPSFFFFFFFSRCCLESVVEFLLFFVVRRVPVREKEREREMFTVRLLRFEPRCERQRCDRTLGDRLTFLLPVAPIDVATERQKGVTKKATRRPHPRTRRPRPHKKKEHHQNPEENTQRDDDDDDDDTQNHAHHRPDERRDPEHRHVEPPASDFLRRRAQRVPR